MERHKQLLKSLIDIKSLSGQEGQLRQYIHSWFAEKNIDAFVQGENLVVHLEGNDRSKAFILNSHMDTVVPGETWTYDPWNATEVGDRMIGLGASDMKSGLAASMLLCEQYANNGVPPVDMFFTYVKREEVDGEGTKEFAEWFSDQGYFDKYKDTAAIFTEPTSMEEVEYGHRGNYFLIVTANGPSGHGSRPDKLEGKTAFRKMVDFANLLQIKARTWQKQYPNQYFNPSITVGEATSMSANLQAIESLNEKGEKVLSVVPGSANKIADTYISTFDVRTTAEAHEDIYPQLLEAGEICNVQVELLYPEAPAGFTKPTERVVQIAKRAGKANRILKVSYGSADMGFLTTHGVKGVILGPGEKDQLHVSDEYCIPDKIPQAVEVYKEIIDTWAK